jgi:hypothetical protein
MISISSIHYQLENAWECGGYGKIVVFPQGNSVHYKSVLTNAQMFNLWYYGIREDLKSIYCPLVQQILVYTSTYNVVEYM